MKNEGGNVIERREEANPWEAGTCSRKGPPKCHSHLGDINGNVTDSEATAGSSADTHTDTCTSPFLRRTMTF